MYELYGLRPDVNAFCQECLERGALSKAEFRRVTPSSSQQYFLCDFCVSSALRRVQRALIREEEKGYVMEIEDIRKEFDGK